MGFESISNAPLPALNKDFAKKKRTNRLAKLKQSKLDVRREQWLSQVKNKECKMGSIGKRESPQSPIKTVELRSREVETEGSSIHDSDMESSMSSPIGSSLDHNDSSKCHSGSSSSSASIHDSDLESLMSSPIGSSNSSKGHSSSSSTSSGYCSGSVSEEEEEEDDDDCLDNWETIADALNAKEDGPEPNPVPNSPAKTENNPISDPPKTYCPEVVAGPDLNRRAWSSNDALRPQTLPNLLKQQSFVMNSDRQCSHWKTVMSQPSSCPICCEDLDVTDTSFLPCSCGFRLCLFCHKRILEADGRCPGCRKHYDSLSGNSGFNGELSPFRMDRSCSMSSRS